MNGLLVTDRLPPDLHRAVDIEQNSADLYEEFDLARRIIQGLSATYLLAEVGQRGQVDELEHSLERIATWISEFENAVHSKAKSNNLAKRMLSLVPDLALAQSELKRSFGLPATANKSVPRAPKSLAHVRRAHQRLKGIFAFTPFESVFLANGCANEIDHLTSARSN